MIAIHGIEKVPGQFGAIVAGYFLGVSRQCPKHLQPAGGLHLENLCNPLILLMVPGTGIEPVRPKPRDFKSLVSTYFTIRAEAGDAKLLTFELLCNQGIHCFEQIGVAARHVRRSREFTIDCDGRYTR